MRTVTTKPRTPHRTEAVRTKIVVSSVPSTPLEAVALALARRMADTDFDRRARRLATSSTKTVGADSRRGSGSPAFAPRRSSAASKRGAPVS